LDVGGGGGGGGGSFSSDGGSGGGGLSLCFSLEVFFDLCCLFRRFRDDFPSRFFEF